MTEYITYAPPAITSFGYIITKLAFKKRFPADKWKAAKALAASNSSLEDFFEDYDLSTYIDLRRAASTVQALTNPVWPVEVRLTQEEADNAISECIDPVELPGSVRLAYGLPEVPM